MTWRLAALITAVLILVANLSWLAVAARRTRWEEKRSRHLVRSSAARKGWETRKANLTAKQREIL